MGIDFDDVFFCGKKVGHGNPPIVNAEVKKYEIYDGITFQWFMCAGILMVGFLSSIIFGDFGMKDCDQDSSTELVVRLAQICHVPSWP